MCILFENLQTFLAYVYNRFADPFINFRVGQFIHSKGILFFQVTVDESRNFHFYRWRQLYNVTYMDISIIEFGD